MVIATNVFAIIGLVCASVVVIILIFAVWDWITEPWRFMACVRIRLLAIEDKLEQKETKGLVKAAEGALERFKNPYLDPSVMEHCKEKQLLEKELDEWRKNEK